MTLIRIKGSPQVEPTIPFMSHPRISIAMATYNGEKYIQEQLDSLAAQTQLPFELVVTDDGSTDNTLGILESFSAAAPFSVRVVRNPTRLGYEENFLKAASLCTGDLIAFCDQDDIWMKQKLQVCSGVFTDPSVVGVLHSGRTMRDSGELGQFHPYFPRTRVLEAGDLDPFAESPGFAMVIRRELVDLVDSRNRHDRLKSHDKWFCLLAASAGRMATLSDVLVWYRQHDRNVFGVPSQPKLGDPKVIRSYARAQDYTVHADSEWYCAVVLERAAERNRERAPLLKKAARKFRYRSRLHRLRTQMYLPESQFFSRAAKFIHIAMLGGYLPDSSGARLGFRRGLKDMFWAVPGCYKLIRSSANERAMKPERAVM